MDKHSNNDISVVELIELMGNHGREGVEEIKKMGGIEGICRKLQTSPTEGLVYSNTDLTKRRLKYGYNVIPRVKPKALFRLVYEALQDVTLIILMIAAAVSLGLSFYTNQPGDWIEGAAILVSVLAVVLITSISDYSRDRKFRTLQSSIEQDQKFSVLRDGVIKQILNSNIVVGDVCQIKYGDLLPVDGVLIQSNDIKVDESAMTGESEPVKKGVAIDPIMLSGTHILEGSGKMLVTAVGVNSQAGIIFVLLHTAATNKENKMDRMSMTEKALKRRKTITDNMDAKYTSPEEMLKKSVVTQVKRPRSILQTKLTRLAILLSYSGSACAILTILVLFIQFSVYKFITLDEPWDNKYIADYVDFFIVGVTILVVAVPEGLPLAVTISLAFAVIRMMKDNNLVRHLDVCETMGNASTICSDKTGTLTTNRMTVVQSYICEKLFYTAPTPGRVPENIIDKFVQGISINTSYTSRVVPSPNEGELPRQIGNKTECSLLTYIEKMGYHYQEERVKYPEESLVHVYTFNSNRKSMSTVIKINKNNEEGYRLYTKGASEIIAFKCSHIYCEDGLLLPFSNEMKDRLMRKIIEPLTNNGLRTLTITHKDFMYSTGRTDKHNVNDVLINKEPDWDNENEIINDLTCIAIVAIEDPIRDEVPEAIRLCQGAGITIRMVTGDNINTARNIATRCNIIQPNQDFLVMDGPEFNRRIRDKNGVVQQNLMDEIWPKLRVLARSSPVDKYNLVKGIMESRLSSNREVVAVTGDGTNDGPALKKADVGFAMGVCGTDVAKEASDIIITDDNFSSIVKAVMWGRNVYDSIAKFVQFQVTVNVVAITTAFLGSIFIKTSPLTALQMLWINIIMDTLAALALAAEYPTADLLLRKPYGRTEPLVSRPMIKHIIGQAIYQIAVLLILLFFGNEFLGVPEFKLYEKKATQHLTILFNTFVMMTLFNEINCRDIHDRRNIFHGLHKNIVFCVIWIGSLGVQAIIVQFGREAFKTTPITILQWAWCIAFGFGTIIWGQLLITIPSRFVPNILSWSQKHDEIDVDNLSPSDEILYHQRGLSAGQILWLRGITRVQNQARPLDNLHLQQGRHSLMKITF